MRLFTLEEANELLSEVAPLAERLVERRQALGAAKAARAELLARISGNGGDLTPSDVADAVERVEREEAAIAQLVGELQERGAQVKDLDLGLLDFPSERDGEIVLLCWRVGEEEIGFWHGMNEGYAGRKPV